MFGPTVVAVEGDFIQRRQRARALIEAGCDVSEASDDLDTVGLPEAQKIHPVLTNIRVPCLGAVSLFKYGELFSRRVPVVVVTAYPEEIEDLEPNALLYKTFGEEELTELIRQLL